MGDDSSTTVRVPFYAGITDIPSSFADPVGQDPNAAVAHGVKADAYTMSFQSIFWVNQMVSNLAYGLRFKTLYPMIHKQIMEMEERLFEQVAIVDKEAQRLIATDPAAAAKHMTQFCVNTGNQVTEEWLKFYMFLFSTVRDGFTITPSTNTQCVAGSGKYDDCVSRLDPNAATKGYDQQWYRRIVADSDNKKHFAVPKTQLTPRQRELAEWKKTQNGKTPLIVQGKFLIYQQKICLHIPSQTTAMFIFLLFTIQQFTTDHRFYFYFPYIYIYIYIHSHGFIIV